MGARSSAVSDWSLTSAEVTEPSAISEEVTEAAPRSEAVSDSSITSSEETAFSASSSAPTASGAIFAALTASSRTSTVRMVPLTMCAERMLSLPTPTAMALPERATNSARQAMIVAGERNRRVLLVIGESFRCG